MFGTEIHWRSARSPGDPKTPARHARALGAGSVSGTAGHGAGQPRKPTHPTPRWNARQPAHRRSTHQTQRLQIARIYGLVKASRGPAPCQTHLPPGWRGVKLDNGLPHVPCTFRPQTRQLHEMGAAVGDVGDAKILPGRGGRGSRSPKTRPGRARGPRHARPAQIRPPPRGSSRPSIADAAESVDYFEQPSSVHASYILGVGSLWSLCEHLPTGRRSPCRHRFPGGTATQSAAMA